MELTQSAVGQSPRTVRAPGSRGEPVIRVEGLKKTYKTALGALNLFEGLDLTVETGEMLAIVGQSGAGKSTLLHILGALDASLRGDCILRLNQRGPTLPAAGRGLSQSRDRLRLAVSLPAAGVYGAGKRGHAAARSRH